MSGGSHGVDANYDSMVAVARRFGGGATDLAGTALALHGYLVDPGIATSGVLDPVGAAEAEAALATALDGPRGLTSVAARCAAIDAAVRAAAAGYEAADRLETAYDDRVRGLVDLPGAVAGGVVTLVRTGSPSTALQAIETGDPRLLDAIDNDTELGTIANVVGTIDPDGHAKVRALGGDPDPESRVAPHDLADVLCGLSDRNGGAHGEIDVRFLTGNGRRRVIVDVPGTKSWDPLPNGDVTSLSTNLRARVGESTAYEQGVLQAMRAAGVTKHDQVLIVGHSEGGMVAVNAARDAVNSGEFDVTSVVTAGSPIGLSVGSVPRSVQVLALENDDDVIPHLDGASNPALPNVTTVSFHSGDGTITDDHSLGDGYLPGAADVDASDDASVRDWLRGAHPFLDATAADTEDYVITRGW